MLLGEDTCEVLEWRMYEDTYDNEENHTGGSWVRVASQRNSELSADTFRVLVVQGFDGATVEDGEGPMNNDELTLRRAAGMLDCKTGPTFSFSGR